MKGCWLVPQFLGYIGIGEALPRLFLIGITTILQRDKPYPLFWAKQKFKDKKYKFDPAK